MRIGRRENKKQVINEPMEVKGLRCASDGRIMITKIPSLMSSQITCYPGASSIYLLHFLGTEIPMFIPAPFPNCDAM